MNAERPPGPSRLDLLRNARRIRGDVLGALQDWQRRYGDVVELPLKRRTFLLFLPDDVRHVLVANQRSYHKTGGILVGRRVFGQGLLASEDPLHRAQRRLMQPMFHKTSIAAYGAIMTRTIARTLAGWEEGAVVDLAAEMSRTTLSIVGQSLFSLDLVHDSTELHESLLAAQHYIVQRQQAILPLPEFLPTPSAVRYWRALKSFDRILAEMIARRRAESERPRDVLTLLLEARHEDGAPMPDRQIRDELLILLLAGHETTSNALTWSLYLLAQHPAVLERMLDELSRELAGRPATAADVARLAYTGAVVDEAMRLFPPVWILARRALAEDRLPSGVRVPPQSNVALPQYAIHRDPRFFPDPERFEPERFLGARKDASAQAFFPFGAGARACIGEGFARMEASILLATIVQHAELELVPGQEISPSPLITLYPERGLFARTRRRRVEVAT